MAQGDFFLGEPVEGKIVGGKYRLEKKLSEGGGGVVWKAFDPKDEPIALKFLKYSSNDSREVTTERFKNEFTILKSLSHPNISQIYDFGFDPTFDRYFFTSELITAGDLRKVVCAPIPLIEDLLLQALRALEYLRGHKLLHLDIKPQNLLLRKDGENFNLALIDFGLATFKQPDRHGGTANYMPPEMIVRRPNFAGVYDYPPADHRSDLYSLGVTFYFVLTGIQPFRVTMPGGKHIDIEATLARHLKYEPLPPSKYNPCIPAYLDRIILKLMARYPDDRYPSAIVAAQALQYSSPRSHPPESTATLLAYLPKEGRLIGRHRERTIIENSLCAIAKGKPHIAPIICIAGGRGTGRSRLLAAAKPFAQRLEMDVNMLDDGDLTRIIKNEGTNSHQARVILIDDLDQYLIKKIYDDDITNTTTEDSNTFARDAIRALVRRLKLQQRLMNPPTPYYIFIFTINIENLSVKQMLTDLDIDENICRLIKLNNFKFDEISEYLKALLGETPDASVVKQLERCTNGSPLFLTEHLGEMIAGGRLFSLAGRPDAKTLKTIGIDFSQIPPSRSLKKIIAEKLNLLSKEARKLALLLSCFDRPANAEELRETFGDHTTNQELLFLVSTGLVRREAKDGRFTFANSLATKIIRKLSDRRLTEQFHDRIAQYLKRRRASVNEIDLHLAYGSNTAVRLCALSRLAKRAIELHESNIAIEHLEEMLRIIPPNNLKLKADTLTRLGESYERARRYADAQSIYRRLRLLKAPADLHAQFRIKAAEQLGLMAMRRRDLGSARRRFQEALNLLKDVPPLLVWRLKLENALAQVDLRDGRFEEAIERFERTEAVAKKTLTSQEISSITNNELGEALLRAGNPQRALPILKNELARLPKTTSPERAATLHFLVGDSLRHEQISNLKEALSYYKKGLKLARTNHMVELEVRIYNSLGNLNLAMGKSEMALKHYKEGLKLAQQIEGETTSVELMIGMGLAAQRVGRPDGTIEYFEAALEFASGPKGTSAGLIRRYRPTIFVSLGDAYYQKHDLDRAETYLKEAMAIDKKQILTPDIRYSLYGTCVEVKMARGDIVTARKYLPTLEAIAKIFPQAKAHLSMLTKRLL